MEFVFFSLNSSSMFLCDFHPVSSLAIDFGTCLDADQLTMRIVHQVAAQLRALADSAPGEGPGST
jgi:hypothetical protein